MSGNVRSGDKAFTLTVLVLISSAIGIYGYLAPTEAQESGRIYLTGTAGAVMFEHRAHGELTENCADCHHELLITTPSSQCNDCHDEGYEAAAFEHADLTTAHNYVCTRCHEARRPADVRSCRACHPSIQESETGTITCGECHDDDYSADLMNHDDLIAIESHECNSCHVPGSISDVYHNQCNRCHKQHDRSRFADADGNAQCNVCHLK